jgi:hypothetical protein
MLRMSGILMTEISVSNVKKINHGHGVPLCQNNVNAVIVFLLQQWC